MAADTQNINIQDHGSRIPRAGGLKIPVVGTLSISGRRSTESGITLRAMDIWLQVSTLAAIG